MAPRVGLEPTTYRLTAGRSTIELSGNKTFVGNIPNHYIHILLKKKLFVNNYLFFAVTAVQKSLCLRPNKLINISIANMPDTAHNVTYNPAQCIQQAMPSTQTLSTVYEAVANNPSVLLRSASGVRNKIMLITMAPNAPKGTPQKTVAANTAALGKLRRSTKTDSKYPA